MMFRLTRSHLLLLATTFLPWIGSAKDLARVNNKVITLEDFNRRYEENLRYFPSNPPSKKDVLEDLIKREIGIQEAARQGLQRDPVVVDRMNTVLYQAFLERELADEFEKIHVTTEDAQAYYQKNPEVRTSHIFVPLPPNATSKDEDAAKARLKDVLKIIQSKKMSFAEAAQKYSLGPTAPMGGDLDYKTRDQLDPAYYSAAIGLKKVGNVSGIVRSNYGLHLIRLTAIRSWADTDQPRIKRLVFEDKKKEIFEKYMANLRKKYKVQVNSGLLR